MSLRAFAAAMLLAMPASAGDLTVATFNTEFLTRPKVHVKFGESFNLKGLAAATWAAPGFRDAKFTEAAKAVAEVIAAINADVIVLTEVGDATDVAELTAKIDALGVFYPHMAVCDCTDSTTQQHVAVLSKHPLSEILTKIPGREGYYKEADDDDSEDDTGISKGLRVTFSAEGQTFHLYGAHLKSERGFSESDGQRVAQASIIRRHYLPHLLDNGHVIVAGDLNDGRGQPALRRIRGLDDIQEDLLQTGAVKHFANGKEGTRWTYEFQGVRNQIDHILVSRSILNAGAKIHASVPDQDNELASDHRPLVMRLKF